MTRITVIGNWHLAFVTAAGLAELGHEVTMLNHDEKKPWPVDLVAQLGLDEPDLEDSMLKSYEQGRLKFANMQFGTSGGNTNGQPWNDVYPTKPRLNLAVTLTEINGTEGPRYEGELPILWLAIDTPLNEDGGPNVEPLLTTVRAATRGPCERCGRITHARECHQCASKAESRTPLIVVSSQVPIGFCNRLQTESSAPIACVPENYRFGKAMGIFRSPDRLVIGAADEVIRQKVRDLFLPDPSIGGPRYNVIKCDLVTAEMIKHATNAFLGTCISFANEMAKIATAYGVDLSILERGLRADSRVGKGAPLRPGGPFTGGTLRRDLRALQKAISPGNEQPFSSTPLVDAVLQVNDAVLIEEKTKRSS